MALGIPAVCSPVGVNRDIVHDGLDGYLPGSKNEWFQTLAHLAKDPLLRETIGHAARRRVEQAYASRCTVPALSKPSKVRMVHCGSRPDPPSGIACGVSTDLQDLRINRGGRCNVDHKRSLFVSLAVAILGFGIVMVYTASITSWPTEFERIYLSRQLAAAGVGVLFAAGCAYALPQSGDARPPG